jgi:NAD(P)-dependent dehydrogenase (short-subunit alcohol dehydrogenase family)
MWDIREKTVLITGGTDGIGKAVARALARKGARVVLLVRNVAKGEAVARSLSGEAFVIQCDLASFASIQKAVQEFKQRFTTLQVLISVAGVMPVEQEFSKDGIELNMAVNYFAPVLLTELLRPLLEQSAPARIVNVTSSLYKRGVINLEKLRGMEAYNRYQAYGDSKLALTLYTLFLAGKYEGRGVIANAVHPGWIRTKLAVGALKKTSFFARAFIILFQMRPPWYGARNIVYLAASPLAGEVSGAYFIKKKPVETKPIARDLALATCLYDKTREILVPYLT